MSDKQTEETLDLRSTLHAIEEAEGEAHRIWDQAISDVVFGHGQNPQEAVRRTHKATALHGAAMDLLRRLLLEDSRK